VTISPFLINRAIGVAFIEVQQGNKVAFDIGLPICRDNQTAACFSHLREIVLDSWNLAVLTTEGTENVGSAYNECISSREQRTLKLMKRAVAVRLASNK
jgi:hypothetical protein